MADLGSTATSGTGGTSRPTMADVARVAGVSSQTVSRVANGSANVNPETAARVAQVIAELGYRPNGSARALKARRSNSIGIITSDTTLYGPTSLLLGVEQAIRNAGYYVSVCTVSTDTRPLVLEAAERLQSQGVEGLVVLCSMAGDVAILNENDVDVPVVLTWRPAGGRLPYVGTDQSGSAAAATNYLLKLGHRTVVHVSGPPTDPSTAPREAGWRNALLAAGATVEAPFTGDWSAASGYDAGRQIARDDSVTAVFAANDQMALGVLSALSETGRRVPADVSVVGFDDMPDAAFFAPPLTTVRQDFRRMGTRFVEVLRRQMDAPDVPVRPSILRNELVIRASAAPPQTSARLFRLPRGDQ
jgi:DNA-binding LacI/PurR family transcriptional regulator